MTLTGLELLLGPARRNIVSPDEKTIEDSLTAMAQDENGWATLSWGPNNYVTAIPRSPEGFELQVELGSLDVHNRISGDPLPLWEIILIFTAFARHEPRWMEVFVWERVPITEIDFRKAPDTLQGKGPVGGFST